VYATAAFTALLDVVPLEKAAIMAVVLALPVPISNPLVSVTSTFVDDQYTNAWSVRAASR